MTLRRTSWLARFNLIVAAATVVAGCTVDGPRPKTSSITSPGILNGILNGFFHTEGLTEFLVEECPLLQQRLMETGDLAAPFPSAFVEEIAKHECARFLFYTVQVMVPLDEEVTLTIGGEQPVASFTGVMGLQHLIQQAYPQYEFVEHGFLPAYPIARKVVTQVYAALTNGIERRVSYRTNVPALDAHRAEAEDTWPREFLQLVPFTPEALDAMLNDPVFLARLPDFFEPCDPYLTNYDYLKPTAAPCVSTDAVACESTDVAFFGPPGLPPPPSMSTPGCKIPVVVHGNMDFVDDVVPGRSCRILQPGEEVPTGTTVHGDVIIPEGGCPLIYYVGRKPDDIIYDDRTYNPNDTDEGCDVLGPSLLAGCTFEVIGEGGAQLPASYFDHYVFNVEPLAPN